MNAIRANVARVLRGAGAGAVVTAAAVSAHASELVTIGSDEYWLVTPAEAAFSDLRPHVEIHPARDDPRQPDVVIKMPIVILKGTNYTASMENTVGTHADPADPLTPLRAPERRLTIGVARRDDYVPRGNQRDKVELSFSDVNRARDLRVDIEDHEPRYVAFDIYFDPTYQLSPNNHYVIHFQALQLGMRTNVLPGAGQPPFSIRVRGTTPRQRDPMAPIDLRFERRWFDGRTAEVQEQVLDDDLDALERGKWYRIVLRLVPGYDRGEILVWHWDLTAAYDRCDGPLHAWFVPWGYKPVISGVPSVDAHRRMIQFALGIYRKSTPQTQLLQFRNIRYGTNYYDVVPGPAC